jgi:hypothetical protein
LGTSVAAFINASRVPSWVFPKILHKAFACHLRGVRNQFCFIVRWNSYNQVGRPHVTWIVLYMHAATPFSPQINSRSARKKRCKTTVFALQVCILHIWSHVNLTQGIHPGNLSPLRSHIHISISEG